MSDFFKQHFDKLLLSALFLIALGTFMHFARGLEFYTNANNQAHLTGVVSWLENTVGQILAALLTLMVGRSLTATATINPSGGATATTGPPPATPAAAAPGTPPAASTSAPAGWETKS